MQLYRSIDIPKQARNCILAIGNFDGVHLGHQAVIQEAKKIALKENKKLGILTFEPHPKSFFGNNKNNFRLTPFRIKFELIKKLNVDLYFNIRFNNSFSKTSAEKFIMEMLVKKMQISHIITGFDFVFGSKQSGDVNLIKKLAKQTNLFEFHSVEDFKANDIKKLSSSVVRTKLLSGDLQKVSEILGRDWSLKARVIKGESRGQKIGFPTINLNIEKYSNICFGVYAVDVILNLNYKSKKLIFKGIANYGVKPTFHSLKPLLEVNIFDFNDNIYGELVEIRFKSFIRKEKKFDSIESLKKQISEDVNFVKEYF